MKIWNRLLLLIVFVSVTCAAYAQFSPTPFTARDGLTLAQDSAQKSGLTNPELIGLATKTGSFPIPGFPVSLNIVFDLSNGASTSWVYGFRSANNQDSIISFAVIRLFGAYFAQRVSIESLLAGQQSPVPFSNLLPMSNKSWFNSDTMAKAIRENANYKSFISQYPNAILNLALLFANSGAFPEMPADEVIWSVSFNDTSNVTAPTLECIVDAGSGQVNCAVTTSVQDNIPQTGKMTVFPVPAGEIAYIKLPSELQRTDGRMEIIDLLGNTVQSLKSPTFGEAELISFSVSDLSRGTYYIRYATKDFVITAPLVVEK